MRTTVLFGPPGTGKTTTILSSVEAALKRGIPPDRIVLCAFTRKAANEAVTRMIEKFGGSQSTYPWFRTLHSISYRLIGLQRNEVMSTDDYKAIGRDIGCDFKFDYDEGTERVPVGGGLGDRMLRLYTLARSKQISIEQEWETGEHDVSLKLSRDFVAAMEEYKDKGSKLDFNDMIEECTTSIKCELFIVDEAQDLTNQQWALARRLGAEAKSVILAGDDDQAIFEWAGGAINRLQRFDGKRVVLPKSYRLPESIWRMTRGISSSIKHSVRKEWTHNGSDGKILYIKDIEECSFKSGSWLLLARHQSGCYRFAREIEREGYVYFLNGKWSNTRDEVRAAVTYERLRAGGVATTGDVRLVAKYSQHIEFIPIPGKTDYSFDDIKRSATINESTDWMVALNLISDEQREYIRTLRANGESLSKPGRIIISTIHSIKGGEADNVVLMTGANRRVRNQAQNAPDPELRVWYVGVSRARKRLYLLVDSEKNSFYDFLALRA